MLRCCVSELQKSHKPQALSTNSNELSAFDMIDYAAPDIRTNLPSIIQGSLTVYSCVELNLDFCPFRVEKFSLHLTCVSIILFGNCRRIHEQILFRLHRGPIPRRNPCKYAAFIALRKIGLNAHNSGKQQTQRKMDILQKNQYFTT